nr:LytR C-terminal domain-containing protein [Micromonospora sp. DSM 115978]
MLGLAARIGQLSGIEFVTVPTHVPTRAEGASDDFGTIGSHGNVLFYDPVPLAQILAPLRPDTETGETGAGATAAAAVPPSQVVVSEVLNGTGRSGLAAQTAEDLAALGFAGSAAPGTSEAGQVMTQVLHPPGQAAAAATLAGVVPGSIVVEDPDALWRVGVDVYNRYMG